ncbi:MAG: RagB/SusD family nutrient uptake outer membrane protein, partial [Prevotella sp.]|nr:RagB/SusD family nutrient uptake outer membrane protein [Prevotella sp.]
MKKYIIKRSGWLLKTVLFTLSFSLLTSCNDWLDVEPTTEMDREDLFSNEAGFADAMSGIYTILNSDALYGKDMTWYLLEMMGGGAYAGSGLNSYIMQYYFHPNTPYSYFKNYQNNYIDPIWKNAYNAIANINSILECIDEKKNVFVGDDYSIIKGEALGLRAFLHFDLMRLYTDAYSSDDYSSSKV